MGSTVEISYFNRVTDPNNPITKSLYEIIDSIMKGQWAHEINALRAMPPKQYKKQKVKMLPAFCVSGKFSHGSLDGLITHSGFICIDIDNIEDEIDLIFETLSADPYIYFLAKSASGKGLFGFVRIPNNPSQHKDVAANLIDYFMQSYGVVLDNSCIDIPRKRFVSYDPKACLNPDAKLFRKTKRPKPAPSYNIAFTDSDIDHIIDQVQQRQINIAENYEDWYRVGLALISEFSEGKARELFHFFSQYSSKYKQADADRKFTQLLRARPEKISIGTLFHMCKSAGVQVQRPETQLIWRSAIIARKRGASVKDAIKTVDALTGHVDATPEQKKAIVDQTYSMDVKTIDTDAPLITQLRMYILQEYNIRYNQVKCTIEIDGQFITDQKENTIYLDACGVLGDKVRLSDVKAILNSEDAPAYHPIREFLESNAHRSPEGLIKQLVECIHTTTKEDPTDFGITDENGNIIDVPERSFFEHFMRKWLVSMIAAAYGDPGRLQLALCGPQNRGKTRFFRNLLPDELSEYYAESSMDAGKDILFRMSENWLMVNDEMGGYVQKSDQKRMKYLLSSSKIVERKAFGRYDARLTRLAVWGGTANEDDILTDSTGNTRIIPIFFSHIDWDKYAAINKTDLFMEAYHAYKNGEVYYMEDADVAWLAKYNKDFTEVTSEIELIEELYEPIDFDDENATHLTASQIMVEINKHVDQNIIRSSRAVGMTLKQLGFEQRSKRDDRRISRKWALRRLRVAHNKSTDHMINWSA